MMAGDGFKCCTLKRSKQTAKAATGGKSAIPCEIPVVASKKKW
jgi:hypothetical protein